MLQANKLSEICIQSNFCINVGIVLFTVISNKVKILLKKIAVQLNVLKFSVPIAFISIQKVLIQI